jgi:ribonuclease R
MQKARYAPVIAATSGWRASYTHFTRAGRRYPDLVVLRALRAARPGLNEAREEWAKSAQIARHTQMERRATMRSASCRERSEFMATRSAMVRRLRDRRRGIRMFIELIEHLSRAWSTCRRWRTTITTVGAHLLRGENTQKVYRLGDKVKVQVIRVDMELRQIDLGLVEILERVREGERGPRRSKASPKSDKRRKQRPGRNERRQRKGRR